MLAHCRTCWTTSCPVTMVLSLPGSCCWSRCCVCIPCSPSSSVHSSASSSSKWITHRKLNIVLHQFSKNMSAISLKCLGSKVGAKTDILCIEKDLLGFSETVPRFVTSLAQHRFIDIWCWYEELLKCFSHVWYCSDRFCVVIIAWNTCNISCLYCTDIIV